MRLAPLLVVLGLAPIAALASKVVEPSDARAQERREDGDTIEVEADEVEIDVEGKTATLRGNVALSRGELVVRCPTVDVRYDDVPHVSWAKGTGGVVAELAGARARAPSFEIDVAASRLTLSGGVRLEQAGAELSADSATVDLSTGRIKLKKVRGKLPAKPPER